MTTQTEVRTPNNVSGRIAEGIKVKWNWVAVTVIGIALIAMALILVNNPFATPSAQTALQADSARYQGLADQFAVLSSTEPNSPIVANSARYQGLADLYTGRQSISQRALDASLARYQGLAELSSGNPSLEADAARYKGLADLIVGMKHVVVSSARYQGLADMFAGKNPGHSQRSLEASSARLQAHAEFYEANE